MTLRVPDIIILLAGVPFAALAVAAYSLGHEIHQRIRWEWLCGFATMICLFFWLGLLEQALDGNIRWSALENVMLLLGYLSLLMFGLSQAEFRKWHRLLYWSAPAAIVVALIPGTPLVQTLIVALVGLPAALIAAWAIWVWCAAYDKTTRWLGHSFAFMVPAAPLLTLAMGSSLALAPIAESNVDLMYAAYFVLGSMMAVAAGCLDAAMLRRVRGIPALRTYTIYIVALTILILIVLTSGWLLTQHLARLRHDEISASARHRDVSLANAINTAHRDGVNIATSLAAAPSIVAAAQGTTPAQIEVAREITDRWTKSFEGLAVLLLDARGRVLTGGKSVGATEADEAFPHRPSFKQALRGEANATVWADPINGTRELVAAAPVLIKDEVVGVLVVKSDLAPLEKAFPAASNTMLVDPQGLIWMSSEPKWLHKYLWAGRIDEETPKHLAGTAPDPATSIAGVSHPLRSGDEVIYQSTSYLATEYPAGPPGWALISLSPLEDVMRARAVALLATAAVVILMLTISTAMRQRTDGLVAQQQQLGLARSLNEMERLMRVLSHDLRTPLAASKATVDYLLMNEAMDGETKELLTNVGDEQMRMADMVTRMLDAIRIRRGAMEWAWGEVDVKRVLESARTTLMSLPSRPPEVAVGLEIARNVTTLHGDGAAIRRLVENLAGNSLRYTKQGEVTIGADVVGDQTGYWLRISVTDTGGGMDRETMALLGRPFALSGKHAGSGSGLGVSICCGICAAHGGRLTVSSRQGEGSQFTAWLRTDLPAPQHHTGEPRVQIVS